MPAIFDEPATWKPLPEESAHVLMLVLKLFALNLADIPAMFGKAPVFPGIVQRTITTPEPPFPGVPFPPPAPSWNPEPPPPEPVLAVPEPAAVFPLEPAPPTAEPPQFPPAPADPEVENSFPPPPPAA